MCCPLIRIGRISRLTPEDEITLGHRVKRMMTLMDLKETLSQSLKRVPTVQQWANQTSLLPLRTPAGIATGAAGQAPDD
ncbi:sigma-70 factor domain-containing protein [Nodosilinea nodulosa]|uniref:sigma-70 factor domain-containing protein n=1 Tax=Nodosilinea nodulosa TaxID=416001 RepID=UPI0018C329E8|nr:sigma-70 factor domain-containing protein [Nodosilinea nodulosa]